MLICHAPCIIHPYAPPDGLPGALSHRTKTVLGCDTVRTLVGRVSQTGSGALGSRNPPFGGTPFRSRARPFGSLRNPFVQWRWKV